MPATANQAVEPSPIDRPSLAALKDLGLSDAQVASYCRVPQHHVAMLRAAYGIADHSAVSSTPMTAAARRRRLPWRRRA